MRVNVVDPGWEAVPRHVVMSTCANSYLLRITRRSGRALEMLGTPRGEAFDVDLLPGWRDGDEVRVRWQDHNREFRAVGLIHQGLLRTTVRIHDVVLIRDSEPTRRTSIELPVLLRVAGTTWEGRTISISTSSMLCTGDDADLPEDVPCGVVVMGKGDGSLFVRGTIEEVTRRRLTTVEVTFNEFTSRGKERLEQRLQAEGSAA